MRFSPFAEVYTADHPLSKAHENGTSASRGHRLREILLETGGAYEVTLDLPDRTRDLLRHVAEATGDSELAAIADAASFRISLEHLRGLDPDTTRIVLGVRLHPEPGDPPVPELDR